MVDGELDEGANWEAMMLAGKEKVHNLIAIVDRNNIQAWVPALASMWDKNQFFGEHLIPSTELSNLLQAHHFKVFFLIRDPRDQTISVLNWLLEGNWPVDGHKFIDAKISYNDKLTALMTGDMLGVSNVNLNNLNTHIRRYLPWLNFSKDFVLVVRYEDLVGLQGGGSQEAQIKAIIGIADHIGIKLTNEEAIELAKESYGDTNTFRVGKIGKWKEIFTQQNRDTFKQVFGKELIELGYEKDFNW